MSNVMLALSRVLCAAAGKLNMCAATFSGMARGLIGVIYDEGGTADP